jgi:hypothetical protein
MNDTTETTKSQPCQYCNGSGAYRRYSSGRLVTCLCICKQGKRLYDKLNDTLKPRRGYTLGYWWLTEKNPGAAKPTVDRCGLCLHPTKIEDGQRICTNPACELSIPLKRGAGVITGMSEEQSDFAQDEHTRVQTDFVNGLGYGRRRHLV